ncbi:hypothetical protein BaRGS_00001104 [Batillaria attramentaria]|uniref:Uncharacterized protein n=1 Tax=Batillaria attramentaria TaxID=370345 RepID=A0ABD0M5F4_9CAEN
MQNHPELEKVSKQRDRGRKRWRLGGGETQGDQEISSSHRDRTSQHVRARRSAKGASRSARKKDIGIRTKRESHRESKQLSQQFHELASAQRVNAARILAGSSPSQFF